jgi:hypothetical protein
LTMITLPILLLRINRATSIKLAVGVAVMTLRTMISLTFWIHFKPFHQSGTATLFLSIIYRLPKA